MNNALLNKLKIKPGHAVLVLNSPEGYLKTTRKVDIRPVAKKKYDAVQLFVKHKEVLDKLAPKALASLQDNGLLWICYPKKSSALKTDLSRDRGWDILSKAGFEGVALVAIDETWSALRFRPVKKNTAVSPSQKSSPKKVFTAVLEKPDDGMDTAYVSIPFDVKEVYGTKGQVKVKAHFDGYPYRGILSNMGTGCHVILLRKDVRQAIGKKVGDTVTVELEKDLDERIVDIPQELQTTLAKHPQAKTFFETLSYTNRKEYSVWIRDAKKEETREKRLKETITKLLKGMKNPTQK